MDKQRTSQQNRALYKNFELIAEKLNDAGYEVKETIKVDIPFTKDLVKKYIWRPIMKKLTGKESTADLEKSSGEIEKIHEVVMRELGEKLGLEYHPFPHSPAKQKEYEERLIGGYPTENNDLSKIPF